MVFLWLRSGMAPPKPWMRRGALGLVLVLLLAGAWHFWLSPESEESDQTWTTPIHSLKERQSEDEDGLRVTRTNPVKKALGRRSDTTISAAPDEIARQGETVYFDLVNDDDGREFGIELTPKFRPVGEMIHVGTVTRGATRPQGNRAAGLGRADDHAAARRGARRARPAGDLRHIQIAGRKGKSRARIRRKRVIATATGVAEFQS